MSAPSGSSVLAVGSNRYPYHRFEEIRDLLGEFLEERIGAAVTLSTDRDDLRWGTVGDYDVLLDYTTSGDLTDDQWNGLRRFVESGGGYVALHGASAVYYDTDHPRDELEELIGGYFIDHPEFDEIPVEIVDRDHPITAGIDDYVIPDEPYELSVHDDVRVLAQTTHDAFGTMPVVWVKPYGDGRVFHFSNGHDRRAFSHDTFQELLSRGVSWAGAGAADSGS